MTTNNFTEAARAEAEARFGFVADMTIFEDAAEWARDYLAAQEPTDAEVEAAAIQLCASAHHALVWEALAKVEPKRQEHFRNMARAALSAARKA